MADTVRVGLDEVVRHFAELDDPRSPVNRRYPLESVVVIALMAVLAGADGPTAIARWAALKADLLSRTLDLPHGVPCRDVFRRVLSALRPEAFQACFAGWLNALREAAGEATGITRPVLSVDGKTARRSHDRKRGLGPLHAVSVWAGEFGLTLGQVACDERSNEITAIPELLKLVDVTGAIVTVDAMGAQKKIAARIVANGADYVLAIKGNQEATHRSVVAHVEDAIANDLADSKARCHVVRDTGHGRNETRTYVQMPAPRNLPGLAAWPGLRTVGAVILCGSRDGREFVHTRYYISSLPLGVKQFARAVRGHWSIENACHWSLDVTYREDDSRIRTELQRENIAWLNRFTLSLLKQHPARGSLAMKRRSCGWDDGFLIQVLTGQGT